MGNRTACGCRVKYMSHNKSYRSAFHAWEFMKYGKYSMKNQRQISTAPATASIATYGLCIFDLLYFGVPDGKGIISMYSRELISMVTFPSRVQ